MSDPVKRDSILNQFSMITRPYNRPHGLKTIPFPAAHTRIANIWEYSPPPPRPKAYKNTFLKISEKISYNYFRQRFENKYICSDNQARVDVSVIGK